MRLNTSWSHIFHQKFFTSTTLVKNLQHDTTSINLSNGMGFLEATGVTLMIKYFCRYSEIRKIRTVFGEIDPQLHRF